MTFHLRFAAFFNYLFPTITLIIRWDRSSQDSKCYCCARVLFNYSKWTFLASRRFMRWFMIKKSGFSQRHILCCSSVLPSPLQMPEKKAETSVGDVCLLNFIGEKRSQVPIFLRSEEDGWGRGRRGVKENRWRWRRAEKVLEEEKQRGRKSKSVELLDTFYVFDEVDWFLPSAALWSHSLP